MSLISTSILALSMSADAFAVSLGKGACLKKPTLSQAAKIGIIFGGTEALTPLIGWAAGQAASVFIDRFDHWIAFFILGAIGLKMIYACFHEDQDDQIDCKKEAKDKKKIHLLFITALATSLDSMAVGVSLAFMNENILIPAAAIGLASFTMSTLGIMIGHNVGKKLGNIAEGLGGLCLIAIGSKILIEHLHLLS